MKVAIIGSREFNDFNLLEKKINELNINISLIVSGGAKGADILGERYAKKYGIETLIFIPDWKQFGKKAGFIRNTDIIENSDIVIAFWNGESKGTLDSINKAIKLKKKVYKIIYIDEYE